MDKYDGWYLGLSLAAGKSLLVGGSFIGHRLIDFHGSNSPDPKTLRESIAGLGADWTLVLIIVYAEDVGTNGTGVGTPQIGASLGYTIFIKDQNVPK